MTHLKLSKLSFLSNVVVILLYLTSCTDTTDVKTESPQDKTFSDLRIELCQMSEEFYENNNISPSTRFSFGKLWNAVKADVKAIYEVSKKEFESENPPKTPTLTFTAEVASASKEAYKKIGGKRVNYNIMSIEKKYLIDSLISAYQFENNRFKLEKAHNIAILQAIKNGNDLFNSTSMSIEQYRNVLKGYGMPEPKHSIESGAFLVDNFIDYYYLIDEGANLTTEAMIKDMPEMAECLKTIDLYFGYAQSLFSPQQVKEYTIATIETINKSAVDAESCQLLTQSLEMAMASFDLWHTIDRVTSE